MSRVLVVEDEAHLAQGLRFNLEAEGYSAEVVGDGEAATDRLLGKRENFDVIVLDIMLPGKDGFSVVSELRAAQNYVPVLMQAMFPATSAGSGPSEPFRLGGRPSISARSSCGLPTTSFTSR